MSTTLDERRQARIDLATEVFLGTQFDSDDLQYVKDAAAKEGMTITQFVRWSIWDGAERLKGSPR